MLKKMKKFACVALAIVMMLTLQMPAQAATKPFICFVFPTRTDTFVPEVIEI